MIGKSRPVHQEKHKQGRSTLAGLIIVVLLGILIYSNSFDCSFQFDDLYAIVNNARIRNLADFNAVWNSNPGRPVAFFTFAFNYHFNQLDVRYWHLVNLAVHLVNALLVWAFTMLILSTPAMKDQEIAGHKKWLAFATALLFVSHPLATQSVTYIIQRMTSLAALFYLSSVVLYGRARITNRGIITRILLFSGSVLCALLAMRTKENAFTLPLAILLIEVFFLRIGKLSSYFRDYRVILLSVLFLGMTVFLLSRFSMAIFNPITPTGHPESVMTPYYYFLTQFSVILQYIRLLFLPFGLNLDHDVPVSVSFFQGTTLISFLVLASLAILAVVLCKRQRIISFGIAWFFLTLSVESGIIPLGDVMVEHRTYLPSVGFFLVVTASLFALLRDKYRVLAYGLLLVMAGSNAFLAYERNKVWKDDLSLWSDVVSKSPGKARSITNRGIAYANRGQWELAVADYSKALRIDSIAPIGLISRGLAYKNLGQCDKAIPDYSRAIGIDPENGAAYTNRGICYVFLGKTDMAVEDFTRAIGLDPDNADAYSNRGAAFLEAGQPDKAMADLDRAISLDPGQHDAILNRGAIFTLRGEYDKAIADYSRAIELNPEFAKAYAGRASVFMKSGQPERALADYSRAVEISPGYTEAWFNRGVIYENLDRWDKAIDDFSQVIRLNPDNKMGYYNRGMTYGKMGKLESSIDDFNRALMIDPGFAAARTYRDLALMKLKMQGGR